MVFDKPSETAAKQIPLGYRPNMPTSCPEDSSAEIIALAAVIVGARRLVINGIPAKTDIHQAGLAPYRPDTTSPSTDWGSKFHPPAFRTSFRGRKESASNSVGSLGQMYTRTTVVTAVRLASSNIGLRKSKELNSPSCSRCGRMNAAQVPDCEML